MSERGVPPVVSVPVLPGNTVKTWESPYMGKLSAGSSSWSPLSGPSVPTVDPGLPIRTLLPLVFPKATESPDARKAWVPSWSHPVQG